MHPLATTQEEVFRKIATGIGFNEAHFAMRPGGGVYRLHLFDSEASSLLDLCELLEYDISHKYHTIIVLKQPPSPSRIARKSQTLDTILGGHRVVYLEPFSNEEVSKDKILWLNERERIVLGLNGGSSLVCLSDKLLEEYTLVPVVSHYSSSVPSSPRTNRSQFKATGVLFDTRAGVVEVKPDLSVLLEKLEHYGRRGTSNSHRYSHYLRFFNFRPPMMARLSLSRKPSPVEQPTLFSS